MSKNIPYLLSSLLFLSIMSCQQNHFSDAQLEEFLLLDNNLKESLRIMEHTSSSFFYQIESRAMSAPQYQPLVKSTKALVKANRSVDLFIDQLRAQLIQATGGFYTQEEATFIRHQDLIHCPKGLKEITIVEQILLEGNSNQQKTLPKAQELQQQLQHLKKQYTAIFEDLWDNPTTQAIIFPKIKDKALGIQSLTDKITFLSSLEYAAHQDQSKSWEALTFGNRPLAAILPTLRSIQAQIKQSEYALIAFFKQQLATAVFKLEYGACEILAQPKTPYIQLGDSYEATISLGCYASQADFSVIIEGDTLNALNGKVVYRKHPKRAGQHIYTSKFQVTNPLTGEVKQFSKEFSFQVIQ